MFRPRAVFFLSFAALVTQVRFTSLLFRDFGLDDQQIGLALGIGLLAGAAMVPLWSRMADTQGCLYVMKIIMIGHLGATLLYAFTPLVKEEHRLWFVLFGRVLAMAFMQALSPVADAYALRILAGSRPLYGKERAWGSFSWGLAAVAVGGLMSVMSWALAYELFTFVMTMGTMVILHYSPPDLTPVSATAKSGKVEDSSQDPVERVFVIDDDDDKEMQAMTPEENHKEKGLVKPDPRVVSAVEEEAEVVSSSTKDKPNIGMTVFLRQVEWTTIVFLFVMLCLEMGQALTESLEFLFIVGELKSSPFLCGVSVAVAVVLEVPLLFSSEPLLRRIGILLLMLFGIFVFIIRISAFTFMTSKNPWVILSVEPLGGIYVALLKMSSVSFMSQASPRGMEAVAMGTMNVFRCMGQVFGTVIGSYVLQNFGSTILYRSFGILVTLAGVVLVWIFYHKRRVARLASAALAPSSASSVQASRGFQPLDTASLGKATTRPQGPSQDLYMEGEDHNDDPAGKKRSKAESEPHDAIRSEIALLELHKGTAIV